MRTPAWCRKQAADCGPSVASVINDLLTVNVLHHLRSAQGILRLAERHSPERVDAACELALSAGDPTYRTIKGILDSGFARIAEPPAAAPGVPGHLHGRDLLFAEEVGA